MIVALAGLLLWFGSAISRLENARYAATLGFCDRYSGLRLPERAACLDRAKTRTNALWNFTYGLRLL